MQFIANQRTAEGAFIDSLVEAKSAAEAMELVEGATGAHPADMLTDREGYEPGELTFIATVAIRAVAGAGFERAGAKAARKQRCLNGEPCSGDGRIHSVLIRAAGPGQVNKRLWLHPATRGKITWIHRITPIEA